MSAYVKHKKKTSRWACLGCGSIAVVPKEPPQACRHCGSGSWSSVDRQAVPAPVFIDPAGKSIFVHAGLTGETFGSFRLGRGGGHHRVKSPRLPMRPSRIEAEFDLCRWAEEKRFERV